jgi:hypothetical protein
VVDVFRIKEIDVILSIPKSNVPNMLLVDLILIVLLFSLVKSPKKIVDTGSQTSKDKHTHGLECNEQRSPSMKPIYKHIKSTLIS